MSGPTTLEAIRSGIEKTGLEVENVSHNAASKTYVCKLINRSISGPTGFWSSAASKASNLKAFPTAELLALLHLKYLQAINGEMTLAAEYRSAEQEVVFQDKAPNLQSFLNAINTFNSLIENIKTAYAEWFSPEQLEELTIVDFIGILFQCQLFNKSSPADFMALTSETLDALFSGISEKVPPSVNLLRNAGVITFPSKKQLTQRMCNLNDADDKVVAMLSNAKYHYMPDKRYQNIGLPTKNRHYLALSCAQLHLLNQGIFFDPCSTAQEQSIWFMPHRYPQIVLSMGKILNQPKKTPTTVEVVYDYRNPMDLFNHFQIATLMQTKPTLFRPTEYPNEPVLNTIKHFVQHTPIDNRYLFLSICQKMIHNPVDEIQMGKLTKFAEEKEAQYHLFTTLAKGNLPVTINAGGDIPASEAFEYAGHTFKSKINTPHQQQLTSLLIRVCQLAVLIQLIQSDTNIIHFTQAPSKNLSLSKTDETGNTSYFSFAQKNMYSALSAAGGLMKDETLKQYADYLTELKTHLEKDELPKVDALDKQYLDDFFAIDDTELHLTDNTWSRITKEPLALNDDSSVSLIELLEQACAVHAKLPLPAPPTDVIDITAEAPVLKRARTNAGPSYNPYVTAPVGKPTTTEAQRHSFLFQAGLPDLDFTKILASPSSD